MGPKLIVSNLKPEPLKLVNLAAASISSAQRKGYYEAKEEEHPLPCDNQRELLIAIEELLKYVVPVGVDQTRSLVLRTPERHTHVRTVPEKVTTEGVIPESILVTECYFVPATEKWITMEDEHYESVTDWALSTFKPHEFSYHFDNMLEGTLLNDPIFSGEARHLLRMLSEIFEQPRNH